jgi:hypothetical protein
LAKNRTNNANFSQQLQKHIPSEDSKKLDSIDFLGLIAIISKFITYISLFSAFPCYFIEEKLK